MCTCSIFTINESTLSTTNYFSSTADTGYPAMHKEGNNDGDATHIHFQIVHISINRNRFRLF